MHARIFALRQVVPVTVLLISLVAFVSCSLQKTVHNGQKRSLFSRRQDILVGGNCTDHHDPRCGPNMICQKNHCKIQVGQQCTGVDDHNCVDGALCRQQTGAPLYATPQGAFVCLCRNRFYHITGNGTCEHRIELNGHCEAQAHGHSPCVEPDKTACHNNTCQCNEDFDIGHEKLCAPHVLVGDGNCTNYGTITIISDCVLYAFCNSTTRHCLCNAEYYISNTKHCEKRIAPGQSCANANSAPGEKTCKDGAACHEGICECDPYHHKQNGSGADATCFELVNLGADCQSSVQCVENAHCSQPPSPQRVCVCNPEYFHNVSIHLCQHKKPAMTPCGESVECVDDAHCVGGICVCDEHFYDHQQRCNIKLSLGLGCDDQVPGQCLINGECVHGHCRCNDKSFDNEDANCPLTLKVGDTCNWYNHDPRQCQSNTTCVFRPIDSHPVCGCDIDHFFNSQYCVTRALAGDPCPYETSTSMGLSMEDDEFLKQCVENAECETTYNVCHCKNGRYNRAGRCPLQIAVDGYCDPWTDNIDQCASNAQCVYGRCVQPIVGKRNP